MVFTRSKARQRALDEAQSESEVGDIDKPRTSSSVVKETAKTVTRTRNVTVKISSILTPLSTTSYSRSRETSSPHVTSESSEEEDTIHQLALRALQALKKKAGMEYLEPDIQYGTETDEEDGTGIQPDIMTLETGTHTKNTSSNGKTRPDILSSSLKPSHSERLYFNYSRKKGITSRSGRMSSTTWGENEDEIMKKSVITSDFEKRETAPPMHVSKYAKARARKEAKEKSAGKGWYDMKAPVMTPELQNDLRLLKMRNALDPSQHYKGTDWKKLPKFFQVGKVVSGAAEFYSSRVPRRQRKMTIMDELLHNHQFRRYQKKKYGELQRKFSSGTGRKRFIKHKKHYKN